MSLDERPRSSARPAPMEHYNSLPRTSIEGALGRKSLADEAAGGSVTNEGNKDTTPRRRGKPMRLENQELEMAEVRSDLSARELWEVEDYFRKQGVSEFIYDEPIDVFRFPEDGRFAFCETFADWDRLQERGYLHLLDEYRDDLKKVLRAGARTS